MSKNFKKPAATSHNAQFQIQQSGNNATPAIVDPRIHKHVEQYARWLQINNQLPVSQERVQAYQDAALEIKQVGKRAVCTFAPFQEQTSALKVITHNRL